MKKALTRYGLLATLAWAGWAQAQVDLSALDRNMAGPRATVAVLGSVHLGQMPHGAAPLSLAPLLDRLAAFKPDVITVEQIPGGECEQMRRYPTLYPEESISTYCEATAHAKAATGLDVPAASTAVHDTLKHWPRHPTPAQRRHLAALFMAAGDRGSALTQWLQLAKSEQRAGDGLDAMLATELAGLATAQDETFAIATRLAARLGLQRIYPVDDHTGDNVDVDDVQGFSSALQQAWDGAGAGLRAQRAHQKALFEQDDMLGLYRYINRPDVMQATVEADFGAALRDPSPQHLGQLYVAGWETRNLRMVANVREAFREHPGARVLSIVGASHKPWFDSLLGQMQGVDVADMEKLLQP